MAMFFPFRPETPLIETLRFLTSVIEHKDGTEQRICMRIAPRQEFACEFLVEDGAERQTIENILFDSQGAEFLVPVWPDPAYLTANAAAAATSLSLSTLISDFRVGSKAVIYRDWNDYELVTTSTVSSSALGLGAGLALPWAQGSEVFPVRKVIITDDVRSQRWSNSVTRYRINFKVTENEKNLYDVSTFAFTAIGFGPDAAKLLISDSNAMEDVLTESSNRKVFVFDNGTGAFGAFSNWTRSRRGSSKTFITRTRQGLWDVRALLHYLQGRQKSFMLPTFASDLTPKEDFTNAATTLDVANTGLSLYNAVGVSPRKYIRVVSATGAVTNLEVTDVNVVNSTTEEITFTPAWSGGTLALANIARISIIEKTRIDSDDVVIKHFDLLGSAAVSMPTKAVLE